MRAACSTAAAHLVGEHDFSSFRAAECQSRTPMRNVHEITVERRGELIVLTVCANAFLHHMVRNIAGVLIAIGTGERPTDWAAKCWPHATVRKGGVTAPRRRAVSGRYSLRAQPGLAERACGDRRLPGCRTEYRCRPALSGCRCMTWFEKIMPSRIKTERRTRSVPEGLWMKCAACDAVLYRAELERNLHVCPKCGTPHAHRRARAARILSRSRNDRGAGDSDRAGRSAEVPRHARNTATALLQAQKSTQEKDALIVMAGTLLGLPIVACAFEFAFLGGSMGSVVGERFVRGVEHCLEHRKPLVCFSASGGARMQEALLSLLQMAKTSSALARLAQARLPYISVLTDPTTGGVSASLAMLGDVNIGEPKALIGFAGARVIQQTVRETLPEGFQRSEVPARSRRARHDRRPARHARPHRRAADDVHAQARRSGQLMT